MNHEGRTTPRVDFYLDAHDPWDIAGRLAAKATAAGLRTLILVPDANTLTSLDRQLWTRSSLSFLPHCEATSSIAEETPVVLATPQHRVVRRDVLINLLLEVPTFWREFPRTIEIVGSDESAKGPARNRFRHYKTEGVEPVTHTLDHAT